MFRRSNALKDPDLFGRISILNHHFIWFRKLARSRRTTRAKETNNRPNEPAPFKERGGEREMLSLISWIMIGDDTPIIVRFAVLLLSLSAFVIIANLFF